MSENKILIGKIVYSEDFGGWQGNGIGPTYGTIIHADEDNIGVQWVCPSGKVWEETIPRDEHF